MHPRLRALEALRLADPELKVAATRALAASDDLEGIGEGAVRTADDDEGVPGRPDRPERVSAFAVPKRSPFVTEGRAALVHSICHIEFNAIKIEFNADIS